MTTWYNHAATAFDPETGLFSEDLKALITNPIAIGEADSTVPLNLLPTVFLGSANTTSGASVTLSGLALAPYKTLKVFANISASTPGGSGVVSINGASVASNGGSAALWVGIIEVDLFGGIAGSTLFGASGGVAALTNASTSVTVAISGGTFNGGSFRVYGCK
jgi:hypothetical protein